MFYPKYGILKGSLVFQQVRLVVIPSHWTGVACEITSMIRMAVNVPLSSLSLQNAKAYPDHRSLCWQRRCRQRIQRLHQACRSRRVG